MTDGTPLMTVPLTRALRELLFFFLILLWHCSLRSVRGWAGPDIWRPNSILREQVAFEAFFDSARRCGEFQPKDQRTVEALGEYTPMDLSIRDTMGQ